jgi:hypothetical protein
VILAGWLEAPAQDRLRVLVSPGGPAVAPGVRGSTGPWVPFLVAGMGWAGQPGARSWRRVIARVMAQGQVRARRSRSRRPPRTRRSAAVKVGSRSFLGSHRRAGPGRPSVLHPGEQLAGQSDDLAPDLVLGVAVQGKVAQVSVFRAAVFTAGAAAVPHLKVGELAAPASHASGGS